MNMWPSEYLMQPSGVTVIDELLGENRQNANGEYFCQETRVPVDDLGIVFSPPWRGFLSGYGLKAILFSACDLVHLSNADVAA